MRLVFSPSSSVLSLAIAAFLHIGIANAVARLGDTPAQCDARYGPARETGGLDADAIVWRRYFKSGYYITLVFMAKPFSETKAQMVLYTKVDPRFMSIRPGEITDEESQGFLSLVGQGWQGYKLEGQLAPRPGWGKTLTTNPNQNTLDRRKDAAAVAAKVLPRIRPKTPSDPLAGLKDIGHLNSRVFAFGYGRSLALISHDGTQILTRWVESEVKSAQEPDPPPAPRPPAGL